LERSQGLVTRCDRPRAGPGPPGPAPGLRAEGLCQGHRGELRSCRRRFILRVR